MSKARRLCAGLVSFVATHAGASGPAPPVGAPQLDATTYLCAGRTTGALSALHPLPSRSPMGRLYERPRTFEAPRGTSDGSISGCAEAGVLLGDTDEQSAQFRRYGDKGGVHWNGAYSLLAVPAAGDGFVEVDGAGVGPDDLYFDLRAVRYNDWSLAAYYRESPQLTSDSFRSLWNGIGSSELKLVDRELTPGGLATDSETQQALRSVQAGTPTTSLDVRRRKMGLEFNARPSESWRLFLSLASEQRQGAVPSGAVFGGGDGGGNITVPQSVDDANHVFSAGASYADALNSLNLALSASLYRNRISAMAFDNPLTITPSSVSGVAAAEFRQGRFALDPDNDYGSARVDFARSFPQWFGARFTASLALGRLRQNAALQPPTSLPLHGASLHGVSADGVWDSAAALTRATAEARIDTRVAALTASMQPARGLVLTARFRDDRSDNDTDYLACNPQTAQFGRLLNDGSGAAVVDVPAYLAARCDPNEVRALGLAPDAGDITLRNVPFEKHDRTYGLTADWRVRPRSSLTAVLGRFENSSNWRERRETRENRAELGYVERGLADATLRASVAYAERGGSPYRSDAGVERRSASLGPLPSSGNLSSWFGTVDELRRFNLADRTQTTVALRADLALGEGFDAGIGFRGRYARYPQSAFGRNNREDTNSLSVDANYIAADGLTLRAFYTVQSGRMQQAGAQPAGCIIGLAGVSAENVQQCGAFGGPLFPADRIWQARSKDRNQVFGAGGRFEFRWGVIDIDYTYSSAQTSIDTAHGDGIVLSPERAALAGNAWPELRFRHSVFSAGAWIPVSARLSVLLRLQLETGEIDDWHYDGIAANPVPLPNSAYLDGALRPFRAVLGGVLLRLAL